MCAGATTLVDFVTKAGLAETLAGEGPFTVVAPDNHAFSKLPADLVDTLMGDVELLKKVLLFHVVPGMAVMRKDITNNMIVPFPDVDSVHIVNVYLQSKYYDVSFSHFCSFSYCIQQWTMSRNDFFKM